ncbi:MAG: Ldh family oxidoreductase [Bacteroidetes bacterium]|nr:Ldh family oxidoreductase [Bacteroidota bacterium]MBU1721145.1 Ldh family oxidoreductase [Bacteroidota bacterium]
MRKYSYGEVRSQVEAIFGAMRFSSQDAATVTDVLLAAEMRNIPSHGIIRILDYFQLWKAGRLKENPEVKVVHESLSTAVVDGGMAAGMVAAKFSMEQAILKAKLAGTGWVSTRNSNHFGIAGFYSMMALQEDMIGICMTNANPLVAPTFSRDRLLGTNPIAVAIPTGLEPAFVADFATTPIARGKLVIKERKGEKVPHGFVQDAMGLPSDDPGILKQGGGMLPLGGDFEHGSHKGYCLGAIVDIFSAVFSAANFGPFVPPSVAYLPVLEEKTGEGTGHFFGAMRIDAFQPAAEFKMKMDKWIQTFRNAKPAEGKSEVLIPGDPERWSEEEKRENGFDVMPSVLDDLKGICGELSIPFSL